MIMLYGYGMESILDEDKNLQTLALKKAGSDCIYIEKAFKPKDYTRLRELAAKRVKTQ